MASYSRAERMVEGSDDKIRELTHLAAAHQSLFRPSGYRTDDDGDETKEDHARRMGEASALNGTPTKGRTVYGDRPLKGGQPPQLFSQILPRLRHRHGFSQRQLAVAAGVSVNQIQRYESGECEPNLSTLTLLCRAMGSDVLVGGLEVEAAPLIPHPSSLIPGAKDAAPKTAREKLLAKATRKEPAAAAAEDRPVLTVGGDDDSRAAGQAIDRLTACAEIGRALEAHAKTARAVVLPFARARTLQLWAEKGGRTENVRLQTPAGSSLIFQAREPAPRLRLGPDQDLRGHLAGCGLAEGLTERLLAEGELKEEETLSIPLGKVERENPALYGRLLELIVAAGEGGVTTKAGDKIRFTAAELAELAEAGREVTVREGFLDRAVGHVLAGGWEGEQAAEVLERVLQAVPPSWAIASPSPGGGAEELLRQLLHGDAVSGTARPG